VLGVACLEGDEMVCLGVQFGCVLACVVELGCFWLGMTCVRGVGVMLLS
jgi:hypothetical protein